MLKFNPYKRGSVDYYKHEMETAKRNLDFVVCGAGQKICRCPFEKEQEPVISACEAVIIANEEYKISVKRYEEAKEKANENNK